MLDYHVHLWRHMHYPSMQATVDQLGEYCEHAAGRGVTELAVTEHLSRFVQVDALVRGFWEADPDPARRLELSGCWDEELGVDLDQYVETALAAKAAGLPVVVGLEVDYIPGQMDKISGLLAGYPFDVLLGSVHWIGAWLFDATDWVDSQRQWKIRGVEQVWAQYTTAIEELAASGAVDVLAHPDLVKVVGQRPAVPDEFHDRIAEAARSSGLAAELNSAGWRKPCAEAFPAPPLLAAFHRRGVPITTASDGHHIGDVAWRIGELRTIALHAGYREVSSFRSRSRMPVPL